MKTLKIALVGNPNSGKTTLFNLLTGSNQYVGNWPGVTVEKKEGKLKEHKEVTITDLPGIYSLSPYSPEEVISREYLLENDVDAIINIVDGTNLERNLYLTTQLTELAIPTVLAVNMTDVVQKSGDKINLDLLSKGMGVPVVEISALKKTGVDKLIDTVLKIGEKGERIVPVHKFSGMVEHAIAHIEESLQGKLPQDEERWYSVKLFERDEKVISKLNIDAETMAHIENHIQEAEKEMDDDSESIITNERYIYLGDVIRGCYKKKSKGLSVSDKIDRVVTNRIAALPIFALIMFVVYYISIKSIGDWVTNFMNDTLFGEWIVPFFGNLFEGWGVAPWLTGLVVDGIISGVGAVLGFVPQILILFIMLGFLEECGYMARIAFVLDRIFRKFGLSGKSFIPMLIGTGCGIPGVMASRTIESERDRRMTIMTTTFMPCSAKLPIIALIAGAFFGNSAWVSVSAYFIGIGAIIVSGIMLKKTRPFQGEAVPFVMELPAYHWPTVGAVLRSMWERGWSFIKKAGTIILLSTVFIWATSTFSFTGYAESYDDSILGFIGNGLKFLFIPLGFGNAKAAVASILGLVAKENVVATFGILYGFAEVAEDGAEIWSILAADYAPIAAYSFLLFNLLCAPCFAAIGAIKREMNNKKWTWFAILYQTVFAYLIALIVYQFGSLFIGGAYSIFWLIVAAAALVLMLIQLFSKKGVICK